MHPRRPSRLAGFSYVGHHRYSLTICASRRARNLTSPSLVAELLSQLRQHAQQEQFALSAYCFMRDHVHVVVEGLSEHSDLRRFVARWKQTTGYRYKQENGHALWMTGYYDRVIRDGESVLDAVRYVLLNPVSGGLASCVRDYAFAGSDVFSEQELRELLAPERPL